MTTANQHMESRSPGGAEELPGKTPLRVLFREFLTVALAEMRSARRLVRTWLFCGLTFFIGLLMYGYYTVIHGLASSMSASIGMLNPRFIMSSSALILLLVFVVALIFLAFDVRARDTRERMVEVLDSRPVGNLTMLAGRLAGLVAIAWLPLLLLGLLIQTFGVIAVMADWPFGTPVEANSFLAFLLVDAPTTLALWGAVVVVLAVAIGNRLIVAVAALALVSAWAWAGWAIPVYLTPAISGLAASQLVSDVLPRFGTGVQLGHRAAVVLVAAGLVILAAGLHPRSARGERGKPLAIGAALVALGALCSASLVMSAMADMEERAGWLAHHEAHRTAPRATLQRVTGQVRIAPDEAVDLRLEYALTAPDRVGGGRLEALTFSLNPGIQVRALALNGEDARFEHSQGLLVVALPEGVAPNAEITLSIEAQGVPNPGFAYLDSALDVVRMTADAGALTLLGTDASLFDDDYVALMPGVFWMPLPGSAVQGPSEDHGADYFTVDMEVRVPDDWLVAGPGRREGGEGDFRFRPSAPVPAVALLAAPFVRHAAQVAGVELELLMSPGHLRNVKQFRQAAEPLQARLQELFETAAKFDLPYPYGALSAVEVPAHLRTYGGGWRLPSVQALPGIVLLREYGFPTSRFGLVLEDLLDLEVEDEQDRDLRLVRILDSFFANDITGGNPVYGAVRNVLGFQTSARGPGAVALDFVVHDLAVQLVTGRRSGFFSPHALGGQADFQALIGGAMQTFFAGGAGTLGGSAYVASTRTPSVWDSALGAALRDLDTSDPKLAMNVLWLKGPEIAQIIVDGLGRETAAAVLAELRRRHAGGNYTLADLNAAGAAVGADLPGLLGDWLDDAGLPGFLVSRATTTRLADDEQGLPRHQIRIHARNGEPVPGLVRVGYSQQTNAGPIEDRTDPIRVPAMSAVEIGMIAKAAPDQLWVYPYLSLNRSAVNVQVTAVDDVENAEPLVGHRPSDWRPDDDGGVYVDDLDPQFAVEYANPQADPANAPGEGSVFAGPPPELDQGLPQFVPFPPSFNWTRQSAQKAWGRYRRTLARTPGGDGTAKAVFSATLPAGGRWRLEYHLPLLDEVAGAVIGIGPGGARAEKKLRPMRGHGSYDMRLVVGGEEQELDFDGGAGEPGWNRIGDFNLQAGEVRLVVSDQTSGRVVIADAIRWLPLTRAQPES